MMRLEPTVYLSPLHSVWAPTERTVVPTKKKESKIIINQFHWNFATLKEKRHLSLWPGLSGRGDSHTEAPWIFKKAGRIISPNPHICIPVCLGQTFSLSLALAVCGSQSRVSLQWVRGTWQLWSGVHHGSNTGSHPRGRQLLFMERGLF